MGADRKWLFRQEIGNHPSCILIVYKFVVLFVGWDISFEALEASIQVSINDTAIISGLSIILKGDGEDS